MPTAYLARHVEKTTSSTPLADRGLSDDIKAKIDQTVKDMEAEEGPDSKATWTSWTAWEKKYKIA